MPRAKIFYWRTVSGKEIDFVFERGRSLIVIEVKLSTAPNYKDTEGIKSFLEEYPETSMGIIIHTGNEVKYLGEKILAIPWTMFADLKLGSNLQISINN